MVNQQLLDYIKDAYKKGVFPGAIKTRLLQAGWFEVDINQAFAQLNIPLSVPDPYADKPLVLRPDTSSPKPKISNVKVRPKAFPLIFIISCVIFFYGILILLAPFVLFSFFLPFSSSVLRYVTGFLGSTYLGLLPIFSGDQWVNNATGSLSIVVIIRAVSFLIIPFGLIRLKAWSLYLFTFVTLLICISVGLRFLMFPYFQAYIGVGINITVSLLVLIFLWTQYSFFSKSTLLNKYASRIFPNNIVLRVLTISVLFFLLTTGLYLIITPQFNRKEIEKLATYTISKGEKSPAKLVQKNITGKILLKDLGDHKDGWESWRSPLLVYDMRSKSIKTIKSNEYEGFGKSLLFLASPNGKYIATTQTSNAFTVGEGFKDDPRDGEIVLYLYDIEQDKVIKAFSQKTSYNDTNTEIDQVRWLPDGASIMFTTVDKNAGYVRHVYRYDLDTKSLVQILDTSSSGSVELSKYNTSLQVNFSNNKDTIYIVIPSVNQETSKSDFLVYKKDLSASEVTKLIDIDVLKQTGKNHASSIKISPNGDWLAFIVEDGYNEGYSLWIANISTNTLQKVIKAKGDEKNIVHIISPSLDGKNLLYDEYGYQGEDFKYFWVSPLEYPQKKQDQILLGECSRLYDEDKYNNLQFVLTLTSRKCLGRNIDQWNLFDIYNNNEVVKFDESFDAAIKNKIPVGYWFSE